MVTIPSLIITQSQTTEIGPCGTIEVLTLAISSLTPLTMLPGQINITGMIPAPFVHSGNDNFNLTGLNNNVAAAIQVSSIGTTPTIIQLRVRPVICAATTQVPISLSVTVPFGLGLGVANCAALVQLPPAGATTTANFAWTVTPKPVCVTVEKTALNSPISAGGSAMFRVEVTNTGAVAANNIQINDVIEAGFTLISSPPGTSVNGNTATTTITGPLAAGASQTLDYGFLHTEMIGNCGGKTYRNRATAGLPLCGSYETNEVFADVTVNSSSLTTITVSGTNNGVSTAGGLQVPAGLPQSGSTVPLLVIFEPYSILRINSSYTFPANTKFQMGEGSEIIVEGLKLLNIQSNSEFYSCDKLWKGIQLADNARLSIRSSMIKDAAFAIRIVDDVSVLNLLDNIFENNYTGLLCPAGADAGHNLSLAIIRSNWFRSTAPLKPNYTGGPAYTAGTSFGFAGIELNEVNTITTITGSTQHYTQFDGLCYGILANNSSVTCSNTTWENMDAAHAYSGHTATGVNSVSTLVRSLTINGVPFDKPNSNPTLNNCLRGIYADGINLKVDICNMTNMGTGIWQTNGSNKTTEITRNEIACSVLGIVCYNNQVPVKFDLTSNRVFFPTAPSFKVAGIIVSNFAGVDNCNVRTNYVSTNGALYGIVFNTVKGLRTIDDPYKYLNVFDNQVQMSNQVSEATGIALQQASLGLDRNAVNGDATARVKGMDGYLATMSPALWCCNLSTGTYNGIHIEGNCQGAGRFRTNAFIGGHTNAFIMGTTGILGEQFFRGNEWLSPAVNYQALHEDQNVAPFSLFTVTPGGTYEPTPRNPAGPEWFATQEGSEIFCSPSSVSCNKKIDGEQKPSELDKQTVANSVTFSDHQAGTTWSLKRNLYRMLSDQPSLTSEGPNLPGFYQTEATQAIGKLTQVEKGIENIYQYSGLTQTTQAGQIQRVFDIGSQVADLDAQIATADAATEAILTDQKNTLLTEAESIENTLTSSWLTAATIRSSDLITLSNLNASVSTGSSIQAANEKSVNAVVINRVLLHDRNLSTTENTTLTAIATQCPLDGGGAVFQARAILDWASQTATAWSDNCIESEERKSDIERQAIANQHFFAYPNPVTDQLTITAYNEISGVGTSAHLYNMLGILVASSQINNSTTTISTAKLPSGAYRLVVYDGKQSMYTQSIIKQ